jgi:hypothetical protein
MEEERFPTLEAYQTNMTGAELWIDPSQRGFVVTYRYSDPTTIQEITTKAKKLFGNQVSINTAVAGRVRLTYSPS